MLRVQENALLLADLIRHLEVVDCRLLVIEDGKCFFVLFHFFPFVLRHFQLSVIDIVIGLPSLFLFLFKVMDASLLVLGDVVSILVVKYTLAVFTDVEVDF